MKVSILVPVYGVEKYIGACAESLFGQTYEELEYVFVDDCSPDHSMAILQEVLENYPSRRKQVRIVRHDRNRGLGAARKTALEVSAGDFVLNVDSDDYLSLDAVEKLVARQQETDADIVSGTFCSYYEDGTIVACQEPHYKREHCLRLLLVQHVLLPHIWARLIRKSLYSDYGISSVEGINMAEDLALTPRLVYVASSLSYIDDIVYYYRDDSTASTFATHLAVRHVSSFLRACDVLWTFFVRYDSRRRYMGELETGMLNAWHQGMLAGLSKTEIRQQLSYRPQHLLFRVVHFLLAHRCTLPLLRLAYLTIKKFRSLVV
jgi:glycosyltransferase involved in cell wall biosynthesis